jgi:hypothetical protein
VNCGGNGNDLFKNDARKKVGSWSLLHNITYTMKSDLFILAVMKG